MPTSSDLAATLVGGHDVSATPHPRLLCDGRDWGNASAAAFDALAPHAPDALSATSWPAFNDCLHDSSLNMSGFASDIVVELPIELRTTATVVCALVLALGITGNLLVPYVVFRTKELRNSTNIFLINLSIADLLVLVVCMPTVLIELHSNPEVWILGERMCK